LLEEPTCGGESLSYWRLVHESQDPCLFSSLTAYSERLQPCGLDGRGYDLDVLYNASS